MGDGHGDGDGDGAARRNIRTHRPAHTPRADRIRAQPTVTVTGADEVAPAALENSAMYT